MTPEQIATLYLEEAKGDVALAFRNLCADAAELQEKIAGGFLRNKDQSVRKLKIDRIR